VYHYMSLSMFGCFLEEQHRNNLLTNHAVFSNWVYWMISIINV
jgi:hypothetical protein